MLGQFWASVADGGSTLIQHCMHVSYLLDIHEDVSASGTDIRVKYEFVSLSNRIPMLG